MLLSNVNKEMVIKDYKGEDTYATLGLRRGKTVTRRRISPVRHKRIIMWIGLFGLVAVVNYIFFVHLGPAGKKEIREGQQLKESATSVPPVDWFDKGHERYQEGDLKGAAEAYTRAIAFSQKEGRSYNNRGVVYHMMGDHDKAIADYNKAIALNPDYAEVFDNRARTYMRKGLWNRAIQDADRAILLNSKTATAYHTRAMAYQRKGLSGKAKDDFHKACELGSTISCRAFKELSKSKNDR